jgi:signal transduction histidine kinase
MTYFFSCLRRHAKGLSLSSFLTHSLARRTPYFLSLITVAILFFGIEFGVEKFFYQNNEIVDIFAAAVGALAFCPLRNFFNKATDRIFFRNSYHFLTVVKDLGERLSMPLDNNVLLITINKFLQATIRPTETVFFTVNEKGAEMRPVSGLVVADAIVADYGSLATFFLEHARGGMIIADTVRLFRVNRASGNESIREHVKEWAARLGIAAVVPVAVQGKIKIIMMVGNKCSGALLNKDDGEFLGFVARRAAIALENLELRELMERQAEKFEERVAARTERLKSMYESQSKFLADVSHEFKTPLAILKMHASTFAASEDARQKKAWYVMDATLDRLTRLVGDLSDVTKMCSSREELHRECIIMGDLLQEVCDDCVILAEDRGVTLYLSSDKTSVLGEWDKLKEVILNLLSNALQHTPAGGSIFLESRKFDDEMEITVRDTGSGISRENLPHIFERFYRIGENGFAGTGIGLYLCRQIIEGHGGTIMAESRTGKGSCFIVHLPLAPPDL